VIKFEEEKKVAEGKGRDCRRRTREKGLAG